MAIELALKALSRQQKGNFKETHDLFLLFDEVSLQCDRNQLKNCPGAMKSWTYGTVWAIGPK